MPTPETLAPERVERLVGGDVPETAREALVAGLVRELRAAPAEPPERLRARVAALRAPAAPPRRRRVRVIVVLAALALAAVAAAAVSLPRDEAPRSQSAERTPALTSGPPATWSSAQAEDRPQTDGGDLQGHERAFSADDEAQNDFLATPSPANLDLDASRARDVDLELELRVADADAVSDAANGAVRAVRELGGHVVASKVATEGEEGAAELRVAIPTRRLEDAVVALSALGTVTAQQVQVEDLQQSVDRRSNRIEALERAIRRDEIRLASDALSPTERLRVELRLESLRAQLRYANRERARLLREAAFAELTLTLHTREAAPGAAAPQGRIERAARDGLAALAVAGSVAVFALILGGPLLLLVALVWVLRRRRVRRANDAILDRPGPAAS